MKNLITKLVLLAAISGLSLFSFAAGVVKTNVNRSHKIPVIEIFSSDWALTPIGSREVELRVAFKGGVINSIGYVIFKKKATDANFVLDSKGTLADEKPGLLIGRMSIEDGDQYVFRFQGESHRPTPALFPGIKLEPFTVQAQLLDPSGKIVIDTGEQTVSIYNNDPEGLFTAYTIINGQFLMK